MADKSKIEWTSWNEQTSKTTRRSLEWKRSLVCFRGIMTEIGR